MLQVERSRQPTNEPTNEQRWYIKFKYVSTQPLKLYLDNALNNVDTPVENPQ